MTTLVIFGAPELVAFIVLVVAYTRQTLRGEKLR